MLRIFALTFSVLFLCGLLLHLWPFLGAQPLASKSCHSIVLTDKLSSGKQFEKAIGRNLVFRLDPERLGPKAEVDGWRMTLVRSEDRERDYFYPVNPPLRFNGSQILGPSYGDDTKTSLSRLRQMRFLLSVADYDRIWPLVTNALWPYSAPHPEKADAEYLYALKRVPTGQFTLAVQTYDADPVTGSIRRINFRAEFTTPGDFDFDPPLNAKPAVCPSFSG